MSKKKDKRTIKLLWVDWKEVETLSGMMSVATEFEGPQYFRMVPDTHQDCLAVAYDTSPISPEEAQKAWDLGEGGDRSED